MNRRRTFFSLLLPMLLLLALASCSHYSLGGKKPAALQNVNTVYVETAKNNSYYPRAEVLLTSAIVEDMNNNGTFRTASSGDADATLKVTIQSIHLEQLRAQPYNTYRSLQTAMRMTVRYTLVSGRDGEVLKKGGMSVSSNYFNEGSQQSAKSDALSFAARLAAYRIVSELVY